MNSGSHIGTLVFFFLHLFSNAQLVLNNGVKVYVNGGSLATPVTVVLNNPPAVPVVQAGTATSQGIVLDDEYNRLQYNLDQGTTAITVPFISNTTGSWVPFPFRMYGVAAGTHAAGKTGAVRFSSKKTAGAIGAGWDNFSYVPSQVSNLCNSLGACPGTNNSANIIDRFWIIEPINYNSAATRPACTFDFTYIMMEADLNGGNTASLYNSLEAQRFDTINTTSPTWGWNGFPSSPAEMGTNTPGTMNASGTGTCNNVSVSAANFFPDWTLASTLIVLPVDLLNFSSVCDNQNTTLSWTVAQEQNTAFYSIQKSKDGLSFKTFGQVKAMGNSSASTTYAYIDIERNEGPCYYRLLRTDKNGAQKIFEKLALSNCDSNENENGDIYSYQNEVYVNLFSLTDQRVKLKGYDVTGRLVYQEELGITRGFDHIQLFPYLSQGVYLFELVTERFSITKKILIEDR